MIPSDVLMKLATIGLSEEQARAVAEMLSSVEKATKSESEVALEARRASDRDRKARQRHGKSRDITGQDGTNQDSPAPSPSPLVPPSQTLPPIIPQSSSPSPEKKRATRLPENWVLPASWGEWAVKQGYSEAHIRLEADKFRDFWCSKSGKDATKVDWFATWRNWMRNSRNSTQRGHAPPEPTLADGFKQLSQQLQQQDDYHGGPTIEGSNEHRDFDHSGEAIPRSDAEERQRKRVDGILFDSLPQMHFPRD